MARSLKHISGKAWSGPIRQLWRRWSRSGLLGLTPLIAADFPLRALRGGEGSGGLDVDRDYVWVNGTVDGAALGHSFVAAVADGEITCYDVDGAPWSDKSRSEVNTFYTCNDEYTVQAPEPRLALVAPSVQHTPPCDSEGLCQSASFLVPVFGDWRGRLEVDIIQDGTLVNQHVLDFVRQGYGVIDGQILIDLDSNYTIDVRVYTNVTGLEPELEGTTSDSVEVVESPSDYWLQGAQYVEAPGSDTSDYIYITSGEILPRDDVCLRVLDADDTVLNTINAPNIRHIRDPGGADRVPATVTMGPSCTNFTTELDFSQVSYGS